MFILFTKIFSFSDTVNRILKYIPVKIVLTRTANNSHCYYPAAITAIDFPNHDSEITSLTVQLEKIKLRSDIASNLENINKKPFDVAYYKRICEQAATHNGVKRTFGHSKLTFENNE